MEYICKGKILCVTNKYKICYKYGKIYVADLDGEILLSFHVLSGMKRVCSYFRMLERVMRLEARCAILIGEEEFLISCNGKIFRIDMENSIYLAEHKYRGNMLNPISFCKTDNIPDVKPDVLYGEYMWNEKKEEVYIWGRVAGEWKILVCFPKGTITHIHQIVYDKYRDEFLIATGDSNEESGIWSVDKQFRKLTPIVKGKQVFRSCFLFPVEDGIIYTTDTPLELNAIYKVEYRKNNKITKIKDIPGPCIFAKQIPEGFVFATSVEPDSALSTMRYRVTYKLGAGVRDRWSHIFMYSNDVVEEIGKLRKDILPMWLFQFGNCQFADNYGDRYEDIIYIYPTAVQKYDGKTIAIKIRSKNRKRD